jgi:hypothetical protein
MYFNGDGRAFRPEPFLEQEETLLTAPSETKMGRSGLRNRVLFLEARFESLHVGGRRGGEPSGAALRY